MADSFLLLVFWSEFFTWSLGRSLGEPQWPEQKGIWPYLIFALYIPFSVSHEFFTGIQCSKGCQNFISLCHVALLPRNMKHLHQLFSFFESGGNVIEYITVLTILYWYYQVQYLFSYPHFTLKGGFLGSSLHLSLDESSSSGSPTVHRLWRCGGSSLHTLYSSI